MDEMLASEEGEAAALQGREINPYSPGNRKHDLWELGYKCGMRRIVALYWGLLEPGGTERFPTAEDSDGRDQMYLLGKRISNILVEQLGWDGYRSLLEEYAPR